MQKISLFQFFILEIHQKDYRSKSNFFELILTCKKSSYFIDLFWRFRSFIIMQPDWQRAFWPISQEHDFYQIQIMYRNKANNVSVHYRTNSVKIKDYFFQIK